jgi:uncharacterized protein
MVVFLGALAGGLVNGLTGFGTALTAVGIWLYALPSTATATLAIICAAVAQLQTLPMIWHANRWSRVFPLLIPGIFGVPLGTLILPHIQPNVFRAAIGSFLVLYSAYALARGAHLKPLARGGRIADGAVGFGGGVLGGLSGLVGLLPVVWADIRGWPREERRAVIQVFNFCILIVALVSHAMSGLLTGQIAVDAAYALPGTIGGAWIGAYFYRRLPDHGYRRVVMAALLAFGLILIWTSW